MSQPATIFDDLALKGPTHCMFYLVPYLQSGIDDARQVQFNPRWPGSGEQRHLGATGRAGVLVSVL